VKVQRLKRQWQKIISEDGFPCFGAYIKLPAGKAGLKRQIIERYTQRRKDMNKIKSLIFAGTAAVMMAGGVSAFAAETEADQKPVYEMDLALETAKPLAAALRGFMLDESIKKFDEAGLSFTDECDVSLNCPLIAAAQENEDGTFTVFGELCTYNFKLDGDDLKFVSSWEPAAVITFSKESDVSFVVEDVKYLPEGEAFAEAVDEVCVQMGADSDFFLNGLPDAEEPAILAEFLRFANENPNVQTLEVRGEQMTVGGAADEVAMFINGLL
jgi:hypothetical protein